VWLSGGDNNIFTQIGFFVLAGLACKNAILKVEFAHEIEQQGRGAVAAAIEAARLRLRPILMTSFGCCAAGAVVRRRRRDASRHGCCCVLRHARRHLLRLVPYARVLRAAARGRKARRKTRRG
jgi:hypothetical protein